ncbi:MAG: transcriptional regulator, LysR family [Ilumatobacteraceae bacterium]|nr:transcriptional regulator, LysR family [Ilumatobacteraceae bacterium]
MSNDAAFDLDTLALLVSVVELGSFSQGGARHGISQPAASMRIARLERQMAIVLLERSTTGSRPTAAGAAVVEWSRELLANAERMTRAIEAMRQADDGVTIAASLTIAEQLLPRWLANLHTHHPEVRVQVTVANSTAVIAAVRQGDAALGFIETPDPTVGLQRRIVAHDRLVVAVAADHAWRRRRTPLQPHQLAATPMVLREQGSGTRATLDTALAHAGLTMVRPVLELASTGAVRNAVAAGVGPTIISELAIGDDVAAGRIVTVATEGIDLTRPLVAIWKGTAPRLLDWISGSSR